MLQCAELSPQSKRAIERRSLSQDLLDQRITESEKLTQQISQEEARHSQLEFSLKKATERASQIPGIEESHRLTEQIHAIQSSIDIVRENSELPKKIASKIVSKLEMSDYDEMCRKHGIL